MPLKGITSPWDKKRPHPFQQKFLTAAFRKSNGISITHGVGGRGVAKTTALILALIESAMNINPGLEHLWSAPTFKDCTRNFLRRWKRHIPPDWYTINKSDQIIYLKNPYTEPTPIFYSGRDIANQNKEQNRGPDWAAVFYDEPRQDPTNKEWRVLIPSIRHPGAKQLILCTASTPRMNWYYKVVKKGVRNGTAVEVVGTSYDNPHQNRTVIEESRDNYDPEWERQEIYGEWVQLTGRVWNGLVTDDPRDTRYDWPAGNMHPHRYDPSLGYNLIIDFGVRSAWTLIQTVSASRMPGAPLVDVVVSQYTPNHGDATLIGGQVEHDHGRPPSRVICGADLNTSYEWQGHKSSKQLLRNLGWNCPIKSVKGKWAAKPLQHQALRACFENALGHRTLCISKHLRTEYPNNRGVIEVINQDAWPEQANVGEFLPKDKKRGQGLEDSRDTLMYYAIKMHPPRRIDTDVKKAS